MQPETPQFQCTFCEKRFEHEPISLDVAQEQAELCGWLCVIAYGTLKAKEQRDAMERRVRNLEDDSYLLDYYRAGCL